MPKKICIASDHAGFALKASLKKLLPDVAWDDLGPPSDARVDYPDFAQTLGQKVACTPDALGILICGSGVGMSIAANKIAGIRAALVENPVSARLSREHNNANVLCLGARFLAPEYAAEIVQTWLNTPVSKDDRHRKRVEKLNQLDRTGR